MTFQGGLYIKWAGLLISRTCATRPPNHCINILPFLVGPQLTFLQETHSLIVSHTWKGIAPLSLNMNVIQFLYSLAALFQNFSNCFRGEETHLIL